PKETDDLLRVAVQVSCMDRPVVLVDEDQGLFAVVAVEMAAEVGEGAVIELARRRSVQDAAETNHFDLAQGAPFEHVPVLVEEILDLVANLVPGLLEV